MTHPHADERMARSRDGMDGMDRTDGRMDGTDWLAGRAGGRAGGRGADSRNAGKSAPFSTQRNARLCWEFD
jgi:hypothetical protein